MRKTALILAAALSAGIGAARADVISYTAPISGTWDDGGDSSILITPAVFDNAIGTLNGVTVAVSGSATVTDFSAVGSGVNQQSPLSVMFKALGWLGIYGHALPGTYTQPPAPIGTFGGFGTNGQISGSGEIQTSMTIPRQFLAAYADPRNANGGGLGLGGDLMVSVGAYPTPNSLNPIGFDGQAGSFTGTLTETFTYSPADPVPEPGSLLMLATGVAMLGLGYCARRRPIR